MEGLNFSQVQICWLKTIVKITSFQLVLEVKCLCTLKICKSISYGCCSGLWTVS